MRSDALLINTSRGGIVDEQDLFEALESNQISGAAIDVFEQEPYSGNLAMLDNCLLTAHMGSMSVDCRAQMEIEACREVARFFTNKPLESRVPDASTKISRKRLEFLKNRSRKCNVDYKDYLNG